MNAFTDVDRAIEKLDLRTTAPNVILLSSGSIAEELVYKICLQPKRKQKILDHVVFCYKKEKYENFMKSNPLGHKLSDRIKNIESIFLQIITELENKK